MKIESKTKTFLNGLSGKYNFAINESMDIANFMNREIYLNSLQPNVTDKIEQIIRMWNAIDDASIESRDLVNPIKIYINCRGGDLSSALQLVDAIKLSKTSVYTINTSNCLNEALLVFIAGSKRYAYPRSCFYLQTERVDATYPEFCNGNYADFQEKRNLEIKDLYMEQTKITEKDYESRNGWWMSAEKANELRVCTEVLRGKTL